MIALQQKSNPKLETSPLGESISLRYIVRSVRRPSLRRNVFPPDYHPAAKNDKPKLGTIQTHGPCRLFTNALGNEFPYLIYPGMHFPLGYVLP